MLYVSNSAGLEAALDLASAKFYEQFVRGRGAEAVATDIHLAPGNYRSSKGSRFIVNGANLIGDGAKHDVVISGGLSVELGGSSFSSLTITEPDFCEYGRLVAVNAGKVGFKNCDLHLNPSKPNVLGYSALVVFNEGTVVSLVHTEIVVGGHSERASAIHLSSFTKLYSVALSLQVGDDLNVTDLKGEYMGVLVGQEALFDADGVAIELYGGSKVAGVVGEGWSDDVMLDGASISLQHGRFNCFPNTSSGDNRHGLVLKGNASACLNSFDAHSVLASRISSLVHHNSCVFIHSQE